jgi:hypothetical protein
MKEGWIHTGWLEKQQCETCKDMIFVREVEPARATAGKWKWEHGAMLPQSIEELELVVNAALTTEQEARQQVIKDLEYHVDRLKEETDRKWKLHGQLATEQKLSKHWYFEFTQLRKQLEQSENRFAAVTNGEDILKTQIERDLLRADRDDKARQLDAARKLAQLLRDEYWAQTPLDVAKLADVVLK